MKKFKPFHGTYLEDDVNILLTKIDIDCISVEEKEKLIQSKQKHYSEMISKEYAPTEEYLNIFYKAMELNKKKVARDTLSLAEYIYERCSLPIIVSLARAGTPVGVLLQRNLTRLGLDSSHYTISIIRDKGIDTNALDYILEVESRRTNTSKLQTSERIFFVDGWTGKGVINNELKKYIFKYNSTRNVSISSDLLVLSDIAGKADISATNEDYLIPSAALNSTISGLFSRSILVNENEFHCCKVYDDLIESDLSLWYVDEIAKEAGKIPLWTSSVIINNNSLSNLSDKFIQDIQERFNIKDINHIKPGIGETTRVLLRRVPDVVLVRDISSSNIEHIVQLCNDKNVQIIEDNSLIYSAVGIIKEVV